MAEDDRALPLMDALLGCLCAHLADSPGGETCFCSLYPGLTVVADYCGCNRAATKCGMAWVRLDRVFPYKTFPQPDTTSDSCGSSLAAVFELGVYRCLPTPDAKGNPPTAAEQTNATRIQLGDWRAMDAAIKCCDALDPKNTVRGIYTARGQGGCGGGVLLVTTSLRRRPPRG